MRNKQNLQNLSRKVIKKKQNLIDEDTPWKFRGYENSGGNAGHSERLHFDVEGRGWDLIPGEESKFDDDRGNLVTFSYLWYKKCLGVLVVKCTDENTLRIWCAELTDSNRTNKVNSGKETYGWQNMDLKRYKKDQIWAIVEDCVNASEQSFQEKSEWP